MFDAGRNRCQAVVTQVEFNDVGKTSQKIFVDRLKSHITQDQTPDMSKIQTGG
ncbi:hypothetical protein D3C71_1929570 [compost metagenome]